MLARPTLQRLRGKLTLLKAVVQDRSGRGVCTWFNQPFLQDVLRPGSQWLFYGPVEARFGEVQLSNPGYEPYEPGMALLLPVYPLTQGMTQKALRALVAQAQARCPAPVDPLPAGFRTRHGLGELAQCLRDIHSPATLHSAQAARRRFAFEELVLFLLMLRGVKQQRVQLHKPPGAFTQDDLRTYTDALPYVLTGAQKRVLDEIVADMRADRPMNRLVQGDVGSGKTALAMGALYLAAAGGRQGVIMAPTEILAQQHYRSLCELLAPLGVSVGLLSGSLGVAKRREALAHIRSGQWQVIAGTHALIEPDVEFADLALAVTDEQHRFGVTQRAQLQHKGRACDVLVMSATPVPRTLALILYGDLDVSVVDELPPGRKSVRTHIVSADRRGDMYRFIRAQASVGARAYIVCPLVEQSDKLLAQAAVALFDELQTGVLRGVGAALVHGRMRSAEKQAALDAFRTGQVQVLVSTTVIEVGVNVPEATIMVVENSERFGLAQLHQLRGRVGRGDQQAWCFLCAGQEAAADSLQRLQVLTQTNDGFAVAQADLDTRGPGDFLGTRQSGLLDAQVMQCLRDVQLLYAASDAVDALLGDPAQAGDRGALMHYAHTRFARRMESVVLN